VNVTKLIFHDKISLKPIMIKNIFKLKIHNLLIPLISTFLLFIASYFFVFIPAFENSIIDKKKELIKEITVSAWNTIDFYNEKVKQGVFSLDQAQKLAKNQIGNIRYGKENKDYLWINDYQPKMIMHPYKEELDNQDLSGFKDVDDKLVFNKMVEITRRHGEGYVEYKWQLKDDSTRILPKISFVKAYEPWKWIIGSGVYLTDIHQEVISMKQKLGLISLIIGIVILILFVYVILRGLSKERLLKEVEAKYQKLFNHSSDAIMLLNRHHIIGCNPKALELFNCSRNDLINKSVIDFSPEYQPGGERTDQQAKKIATECMQGEAKFFEWVHYTKNKKPFTAEVSLSSVEISGQVLLMSTIRDITKRKTDEKKLREALAKSENADKLKTAFLANMSHEIRTPMNGILGFSQLIRNENLPEKQRNDFIDIINSKANQLLQIINDIIDISKIESNQIKLYYSEFSVNKMFDDLYSSFRTETNEVVKSTIDLVVKKDLPDGNDIIKSDKTRIMQILYNLLSNAFKYSDEGMIELGYLIKHSEVEFYVKDNGIGVKASDKNIIFDHFTQSDGSSRRLYGGTGLGLSISKGLVELLGGKIAVQPNLPNGSRFSFTVPHKFVSSVLDTQPGLKKQKMRWPDKNILVVEDDTISYEYIKECLRCTKANLTHVKTGNNAISQFKENNYDLILMDIQLPGIDGYETTSEIRKIDAEVPIIAQTANAFVDDRNKSLAAGCNDYIAKPIERKLLLKIINHYI